MTWIPIATAAQAVVGRVHADDRPTRRLDRGWLIIADDLRQTVRLVGLALDPHRQLVRTGEIEWFADDLTEALTTDTRWRLQ